MTPALLIKTVEKLEPNSATRSKLAQSKESSCKSESAICLRYTRIGIGMKEILSNKNYRRFVLVGGMIPIVLILNDYFGLPDTIAIILVIFLSLIFGSLVLWAYANRHTDGSEWWQDDSASGWRGY